MRPLLALVVVVVAACLPGVGYAADDDKDNFDEVSLKAAGLGVDSTSLVQFFKLRSQASVDRGLIDKLVRQLSDATEATRTRAAAELICLGPAAIPALRHTANDLEDAVAAGVARKCLQYLEGPSGPSLAIAALRLLADRQPTEATDTLIAYLPFADDDAVLDQTVKVLAGLAYRGGKVDPVLVKALAHETPVRRAVAAEALCQTDQPWPREAVHKLLKDPKPSVRLRVALALARAQEIEAIGVLIDLLAELPKGQRRQSEDFLVELAGEYAPKSSGGGDDEISLKIRRETWATWWKGAEGTAMLAEVRKRTLSDADRQRVEALIGQLGEDKLERREKAHADLVAIGFVAAPLLRRGQRGASADLAGRLEACLKLIDKDGSQRLPMAAIRLLAFRRPDGAVAALLDHLPMAEDDSVLEELARALTATAIRAGKVDPLLVRALTDKEAIRRASAGEILAKHGGDEHRPAVKKLLQDEAVSVRLRIALALAAAGDKDAVPILIEVLATATPDQAWPVEDFLQSLAGDKSPAVALGTDATTRQKCRDAWAAWWKANGDQVDLAKARQADRLLGHTLIVQMDDNYSGRVLELSPSGSVRWQVDGFQFPVSAQWLPGNRVLVAEYNATRVTERDLKGNILWEKALGASPNNAQRLANGNTFVATPYQLFEFDKSGKDVWSTARLSNPICAAAKLRNGQIVTATYNGRIAFLDATGKELKSFMAGGSMSVGGMEVTPSGRILVASYNLNKVIEFDMEGKSQWQADVSQPTTASRLPNGNVLVSSFNGRRVVELNRSGKTVWEHKDNLRPWKALRR